MGRMEVRNAILKARMDKRAAWFGEFNVFRAHYRAYKALVRTHAFAPAVPLWWAYQEAAQAA